MKNLLLMRHAKSSWDDQSVDDFHRVLNSRGRKSAPMIGHWLLEQSLVPDLILSSTALRAKETTELVVEASGYTGEIVWDRELYLASPETLLAIIAKATEESQRVLVVAHNPGMEHLVATIRDQFDAFPTAALACFSSTISSWKQVSQLDQWKLTHFLRPKEL